MLERVRERLREALARFQRGQRRGLILTLIAALRLHRRGEPITAANVVREARRIIRETRGKVDWGVTEEEYSEALATDLLEELVEMGVLEPSPDLVEDLGKRYRFRSYREPDDVVKLAMELTAPLAARPA